MIGNDNLRRGMQQMRMDPFLLLRVSLLTHIIIVTRCATDGRFGTQLNPSFLQKRHNVGDILFKDNNNNNTTTHGPNDRTNQEKKKAAKHNLYHHYQSKNLHPRILLGKDSSLRNGLSSGRRREEARCKHIRHYSR